MTITKNSNNNIYTYTHTTRQAEEEHATDETELITNWICQDVDSFNKTNEQEYLDYCITCEDIFDFL